MMKQWVPFDPELPQMHSKIMSNEIDLACNAKVFIN